MGPADSGYGDAVRRKSWALFSMTSLTCRNSEHQAAGHDVASDNMNKQKQGLTGLESDASFDIFFKFPETPNGANVSEDATAQTGDAQEPRDYNDILWIVFLHARDGIEMEYTIRVDVESVKVRTLSSDFKTANGIDPGEVSGDRSALSDVQGATIELGWALAWLNPCLRGKDDLLRQAISCLLDRTKCVDAFRVPAGRVVRDSWSC